jgi:hypothetical protein
MLPFPTVNMFVVMSYDDEESETALYRPIYLTSQSANRFKVQSHSTGISVYRAPLDCKFVVRGKPTFYAIKGADGFVNPQTHLDIYESWGGEENLCYHAVHEAPAES